jgi:hypothetical protein
MTTKSLINEKPRSKVGGSPGRLRNAVALLFQAPFQTPLEKKRRKGNFLLGPQGSFRV